MNALHVPGSPYLTLNVTGLAFNITSGYPFVSIEGIPVTPGGLKLSGKVISISTKAQTWVLYSLLGNHNPYHPLHLQIRYKYSIPTTMQANLNLLLLVYLILIRLF